MRNWLAGIIAFAGLLFFFLVERNLLGFIILIICAVIAAILFSEREMDERVKKIREARQKRNEKREAEKKGLIVSTLLRIIEPAIWNSDKTNRIQERATCRTNIL